MAVFREAQIHSFLSEHRWLAGVETVQFLAAGEYNENYRVDAAGDSFVFRINHGTQLDQADQITYEFNALAAVAASKRTPIPLRVCSSDPRFPHGALLMTYIRGGTFDYAEHSTQAAELFARIHELPTSPDLIVQANPVGDIVAECNRLLDRFPEHPLPEAGRRIREYREHVVSLQDEYGHLFEEEQLCTVNTEVNSGNFIVDKQSDPPRVWLVDWEKAVSSYRYQDLGHFLVPTTTLWKSEFRFDPSSRRAFLNAYANALSNPPRFERLDRLTWVLEQTILLRALSWCYMAYVEYTQQERALRNEQTFARIRSYLRSADELLAQP